MREVLNWIGNHRGTLAALSVLLFMVAESTARLVRWWRARRRKMGRVWSGYAVWNGDAVSPPVLIGSAAQPLDLRDPNARVYSVTVLVFGEGVRS